MAKKCVWKTRNGNVFNDERISPDKSSCRFAALTSFKLLTFCIVQASMYLLSLNRYFLRCHYCVDLSLFILPSSPTHLKVGQCTLCGLVRGFDNGVGVLSVVSNGSLLQYVQTSSYKAGAKI